MAKVSVIIPVYNVERYIERCARSLFEQTLDDMEYVFVDDCTPDNSIPLLRKVISSYPEREGQVRIIRHGTNKGQSMARNTGLSAATGEYVAYCDSDDYVDCGMYGRMYEAAEAYGADIVWCDFYDVYADGIMLHKTVDENDDRVEFLRAYMKSWTVVWNMLVKKTLYLDHGLKFPAGIVCREDFYLSVVLHYYAAVAKKVDAPLYYYNRTNSNSLLKKRDERTMDDILFCDLSVIEFFKDKGVLEEFQKDLSYGVLRDKQDLVLNPATYGKFLSIYPESHRHIWSCPTLNVKIKCMMWLVANHLSGVASMINFARRILNRE